MATTTADEAIKARMQASAQHCDGAFSTDESDTDEAAVAPAVGDSKAPAGSLRGSVHDIVRKLEAGN